MSFLLDRIRNWRLKHKIPKKFRDGGKFRYDVDGLTKIPVDDNEEIETYNLARKRQKEKDDLENS